MAGRSVGTKTEASWDQEVSEVDVLTIINIFKLADLDDVYTLLGLNEKDVELVSDSPRKQAKHLLNLWRNRNGNEATRGAFIDAVEEECRDFQASMDQLKTKWNISPSDPKRRRTEETRPVINAPYDNLDLEMCQKKLKEIYKDRRGWIGFLPGLPKKDSSDEFFVDLKLLKEQHTPTEVKHIELKTYTDLFKIQDRKGRNLEHVIVSGLAGTGKTTLVSRLAYQWADINKDNTPQGSGTTNQQSSHPLSRFQLVFTLDIRKFKPNLDLVDTIQVQLLQHPMQHISKPALISYLAANADKCLFLFDGYDELGLDEIVLNSNLLCGAHVILTTRPEKVEQFYDKHQESRYVQVQLKGFSNENAAQFVEKFFGQSRDQGNEATSLIKAINSKSYLTSFSQFPLLLAMMCLLWKDKKCLPTTMTLLYHQLIEYLAKHLKAKPHTFYSTYAGCKPLLIQLGKTGFEALINKNSKLIFSEDEFDSKDIVENGYMLGLLTKNSKVSGFDTVPEISFIHKTFQEFCAAIYLCSVGKGNSKQLNSYLSQINIDNMENVLRFCCGENAGNVVEDILKHVVDLSCESKQQIEKKGKPFGIGYYADLWRLPLTLLFEAESQFGFTELLHNLFEPLVSHIRLFNKMVLPGDDYLNVLDHYVSESKTQNNWLRFVVAATVYGGVRNVYISSLRDDDDDVSMHVLKMITMAHMPNLSTLTIGSTRIYRHDCSQFINAIQSKMVYKLPRILDIDNCTCDTAVLHKLLVTQPNLKILSIPFQKDKPADIEALGQVLDELAARAGSMKKLSVRECDMSRFIPNIRASWNTLERLDLISTHMAMGNWQELFNSIIDAGQENQRKPNQEDKCDNDVSNGSIAALPLKYLDLGGSHIGDSSFKLADAMKYISSLEYLGLNSNNLDGNHFSVIGPALKYLSNLTRFDMRGNRIGNSLEAITRGLNNCKLTKLDISKMKLDASNNALSSVHLPTVKKLYLHDSNITSHGAKALSKSLPYMPMLKEIMLSHNSIGSDGARALSSSFKYIPQLSHLDLLHNNIGSDGAIALSTSFQHIPKLSVLDLSHNNIGSDGAIALLSSLQHIPQLSFLDLSHSNIGSDGAIALSSLLQQIPTLSKLDLSHNNIGSDSAISPSSSFQYVPKLYELDLSHNNIGSDGAIVLSSSFQHMPHLSMLYLSDNNIGSDGAIALSASFHHLPHLIWLYIDNNPIGPDGVEGIFKNLHLLPELDWLSLQSLDSQNEPSELLKACINALRQSDRDIAALPKSHKSPTHILQHTHDSDNKYWFNMDLYENEKKSVISVIKEYNLRHR